MTFIIIYDIIIWLLLTHRRSHKNVSISKKLFGILTKIMVVELMTRIEPAQFKDHDK